MTENKRKDRTWLNLVWRAWLTSSKARRSVANSLRASLETRSLAIPSQSMFFPTLNATSVTFFTVPLIFFFPFLFASLRFSLLPNTPTNFCLTPPTRICRSNVCPSAVGGFVSCFSHCGMLLKYGPGWINAYLVNLGPLEKTLSRNTAQYCKVWAIGTCSFMVTNWPM